MPLHIPWVCRERGCTASAGGVADIPGVTVQLGGIPVSLVSLCDTRWLEISSAPLWGLPVLMYMPKMDVCENVK